MDVWEERTFISRYEGKTTGLVIYKNNEPTDATTNVLVDMVNSETGAVVFSDYPAYHTGEGSYEVLLNANDTATPGFYDLIWTFTLDTVVQTAKTFIEVGSAMPDYASLSDEMQMMVDSVWIRLADLFDSPYGGPNLSTYFQTKFDRNRIAQLAKIGLGRLNTIAQPHMTYSIGGPKPFPMVKWGALLEQATWIEVIKHLIRSYGEQPNWPGVTMARADRQHYVSHWRSVLADETGDLEDQLDSFKIAHMGLGRPHVTVAGGVYGNYAPTRMVGSHATRPRYWARFYA